MDALRLYGPKSGVEAHDRLVDDAGEMLAAELQSLVRSRGRTHREAYEDAAQDTLLQLQSAGPRGVRHGDQCTDEGARHFLATCLRNRVRDALRRRRPAVELTDDLEDAEAGATSDWSDGEVRTAVSALEACKRRIVEGIGPTIAEHRRGDAGESFQATLREMVDVNAGRLTPKDLLDAEERRPIAENRRTRRQCANAVYARHARVARAVREHVDDLRRRREIQPIEHACLCAAMEDLRLRLDPAMSRIDTRPS